MYTNSARVYIVCERRATSLFLFLSVFVRFLSPSLNFVVRADVERRTRDYRWRIDDYMDRLQKIRLEKLIYVNTERGVFDAEN